MIRLVGGRNATKFFFHRHPSAMAFRVGRWNHGRSDSDRPDKATDDLIPECNNFLLDQIKLSIKSWQEAISNLEWEAEVVKAWIETVEEAKSRAGEDRYFDENSRYFHDLHHVTEEERIFILNRWLGILKSKMDTNDFEQSWGRKRLLEALRDKEDFRRFGKILKYEKQRSERWSRIK
mmetsp:Transcript_22870/g.65733  ORF Transcript_22870/g.65733 Transcript_22870/m.65733 type:complete len:178 (+) Transcript_22870:378-911(+)